MGAGSVELRGYGSPPHDASGRMHVAFAVEADRMMAWRRRLVASGVGIESVVEWPGGQSSAYFRDPAGNLVELATPGLWARPAPNV
ncbi:VOC family protein [Rubrimonas cliftonensis]|uniref:VOC family protein n=1 Tax=Rubrimonas cliftonensis TaxID=89524 RepID=UPI000B8A3394